MKLMSKRPTILWQAVLVFLIILDGILLLLTVISPNLKMQSLLEMGLFDLAVSVILLIMFIWRIKPSENRKHLLTKKDWILLMAFVPIYFIAFDILGLSSSNIFIKILAILKIVALYLFASKMGKEVIKYQEKTRLVYALAVFLVVFFFCSYLFYYFEHPVNPEVGTFEDSIWFVLQTITTVGYGDIIPITGIGRLMGVISMFSALVLTSIITSVATFSLIEKFRKGTELIAKRTSNRVNTIDEKLENIDSRLDELDKIDDIHKSVTELKDEIESLKELIKK